MEPYLYSPPDSRVNHFLIKYRASGVFQWGYQWNASENTKPATTIRYTTYVPPINTYIWVVELNYNSRVRLSRCVHKILTFVFNYELL
jgi:hypothetical protein